MRLEYNKTVLEIYQWDVKCRRSDPSQHHSVWSLSCWIHMPDDREGCSVRYHVWYRYGPYQLLGGTYSTSLSASGYWSSLLVCLSCYNSCSSEGPETWQEEDCWWNSQSKPRNIEASSVTAYVFILSVTPLNHWIEKHLSKNKNMIIFFKRNFDTLDFRDMKMTHCSSVSRCQSTRSAEISSNAPGLDSNREFYH